MKTALRVLETLMDGLEPEANDIEDLRRFAPEHARDSLDDLACAVIHKAMRS